MKILIVEDEAVIAESLYQLLALLDYEPLEPVATPEEAIDAINEERPDLLILDITLAQERTGLEIADYIIAHNRAIPYIILTAHSDAATLSKVKKYKPAAYLVKPFNRENLFAAIELAIPEEEEKPVNDVTESNIEADDLFLKIGTRYEKIRMQDVRYLQSKGKYTELHFPGNRHLVRMSLSTFITSFGRINWIRVHKSYAVNPAWVKSITPDEIYLDGAKIPVGRFFQPEVERYFLHH